MTRTVWQAFSVTTQHRFFEVAMHGDTDAELLRALIWEALSLSNDGRIILMREQRDFP